MSNMEKQIDINTILRYLGSFALLIAIFPYSSLVVGAWIVNSVGIEKVTTALYIMGFIGFVLAILSYIIGNEKQSKIFFAGSILITSISLLVIDFGNLPNNIKGIYIGTVFMYLILGIIMLFLFMKEEALDENIKNFTWMGIGLIYLIATIMQTAFMEGGFDEIGFSDILMYNYFIPQTIIMGGIFGFFVAIIILIKPIMKMVNISEDAMKTLSLLLVFSVALGMLYETYGRLIILYNLATTPPVGVFGILYTFGSILTMGQVFYAILITALILHIIQEYA